MTTPGDGQGTKRPGAAPIPGGRLDIPREKFSRKPANAFALSQAKATETSGLNTAQTLRKRKLGVYAVGIAVIVVAGSLFGAQIKEVAQANNKRKQIEAVAQELVAEMGTTPASEESISSQLANEAAPGRTSRTSHTKGHADSPVARQTPQLSIDTARQIALLEDRKALLNRQKNAYEAKIGVLRERQAKRAEENAKRGIAQQNG